VTFEPGSPAATVFTHADERMVALVSVVPTPQNGEPLADGKIYRRDLWAGEPSEFAVVRQSQVGGNWW